MGFSEASRGFQDFSVGLYAVLLMVMFFVFPDGLSSVLFRRDKAAKRSRSILREARGSRYGCRSPRSRSPGKAKILEVKRHIHVLRRHRGPFRRLLLRRLRPDRRHHRPQRRRQDDAAQRDQRLPDARRGQGAFQGSDVTRKAPHEMATLGAATDLPAHQPLQGHDGDRERHGRVPPQGARRASSRAACASAAPAARNRTYGTRR